MAALRLLAFLLGLVVVASTLNSAVRFFVLPRGVPDRVARQVFLLVRQIFNLRLRRSGSYAERDRVMALMGRTACWPWRSCGWRSSCSGTRCSTGRSASAHCAPRSR